MGWPREYRLRVLAESGYTRAEIGGELGCCGGHVRVLARRAGVALRPAGRPPDVDQRARVLDLIGRGVGVSEVARRTGRTLAAVKQMVRRLEAEGLVRREPAGGRVRWRPSENWD